MPVTFNPSIRDVYLGDYRQLDGLAIVRDRLLGDYDLGTISELTIEVFAVFHDLITPKNEVDRSNNTILVYEFSFTISYRIAYSPTAFSSAPKFESLMRVVTHPSPVTTHISHISFPKFRRIATHWRPHTSENMPPPAETPAKTEEDRRQDMTQMSRLSDAVGQASGRSGFGTLTPYWVVFGSVDPILVRNIVFQSCDEL